MKYESEMFEETMKETIKESKIVETLEIMVIALLMGFIFGMVSISVKNDARLTEYHRMERLK